MSLWSRAASWVRSWRWIGGAELHAAQGGAAPPWVVDVREPGEFSGPLGHLPAAENIPLARFAADAARLVARHPGRPLVLVCLTDKRSSAAAGLLARAGRRNVRVLSGGMKAWTAAGLPVVK
jgi:rhodanese-related sulfurtransferase